MEGKIKGTGRRGRRHQQLLGDLKETQSYWNLKEEALDRTVCRAGTGRAFGNVERKTLPEQQSSSSIVLPF